MSLEPTPTPTFAGEFVHGVDAKGRVTVPSDWRYKLEGEPYYLVVDSSSTYLHAMPPAEFQKVAAQAEAALPPAQRAIFLQNFFSRATKVETDKQGRLLLPDKRTDLGLTKEAVLVGSNATFKFFSKEAWEKTKQAQAEEYQKIAASLGV